MLVFRVRTFTSALQNQSSQNHTRPFPSTKHRRPMQAPTGVSVGSCMLCSCRIPWDCWWVAAEGRGHSILLTRWDLDFKCHSQQGNHTGFGGSGCSAFKSRLAGAHPPSGKRHYSSPDFINLGEGGDRELALSRELGQQGSIA